MGLKQQQIPLSVNQQIDNLKALNLTIQDESLAASFLNDVSYFRFIKAYSLGLKPKNGSYYSGTTFEQLMELYLFNSNFRQLLFPLIERVEILSFGTLSKLYKNMKNTDKKQIASIYGIGYTYLESWIENIAYVRNLCAHYGRLYNAKFTKTPKLYYQDRKLGITNNRIFGVLCCLKYLLPNDRHWMDFLDSLNLLFEKYPHADKTTMGFTKNWQELLKSR